MKNKFKKIDNEKAMIGFGALFNIPFFDSPILIVAPNKKTLDEVIGLMQLANPDESKNRLVKITLVSETEVPK